MAHLLSVNRGAVVPVAYSSAGQSGIDKRPVDGPVPVRAPGPRGSGGSGLAGDGIGDLRHHGGHDQAVYAYAAEDLNFFSAELGKQLIPGMFGENLTTLGLPVTDAVIGEQWRVGDDVLLEVSVPRTPCRTFAGWLVESGWIRRFVRAARPGAYLRVIVPGSIRAGDRVEVINRPDHALTIGEVFRALTLEPALLPLLVPVAALPAAVRDQARRRSPAPVDSDLF